jgi:hypothetical protein
MGPLIVFTAALAAQTTTASGQAPAPPNDTATTAGQKAGQSTYLDIEGGVGYSSNPRLNVTSSNGEAFGRISLHAVHTRISARTTTLLSAYAENLTYTSHYGSQQSLSFYGRHDAAVSEHVRVFGDVNASYQQGGQLDTTILVVPNVPPLTGIPTTPIILPPGGDFLTIRGKEYQLSAHGGAQFALSPFDDVSVSTGVERTVFRSAFADTSYTTVPVTLAYDRRLSERTTVGARITAQNTEYNGPASVRMYTPQLTGRLLLSPTVSLDGAVGVSFARVDDGISTRHTTGLAANANLCSTTASGQLCGHAAIDQEAATAAGPAKSISGGIDYSRRLDADSTVAFSLSVNRYSSPISVIVGQPFSHATYFRAAGEYSRRIGNRWFGGVNLAARKLTQVGPDPKTDFSASLFIRYRFGDIQ